MKGEDIVESRGGLTALECRKRLFTTYRDAIEDVNQ